MSTKPATFVFGPKETTSGLLFNIFISIWMQGVLSLLLTLNLGVLLTAWMAALGNKEQQEVQQKGKAGCCTWDGAMMSGWRGAGQKGSWGGWWQQAHGSLQLPKQEKCKRKVLVTAPSLMVTGRRVTAHSCTRGGSDWTLENISLP